MSLKTAAKYIESQGRGNDSRLMHVSPRELQGLQALAKAKGGSLTINPTTGLPEAGFLEDVLPVAAAGAMMFLAPGVAPAIGAGLGLGEGALATGVGMGLLSGGISAAGQLLSTGKIDAGSALKSGALSGLTAGAMQGLGAVPTSNVQTPVPAATVPGATVPTPDVSSTITTPSVVSGAQPVNPITAANATNDPIAAMNASQKWTQPWDASLDTPAKEGSWWSTLSPGQKLATGLGGVTALSMLGSQNQPKLQTPPTTSYIRPYTYSQTRNPNWGQPGQSYYTQTMTPQPIYKAAEGGLMAIGGTVERMSQVNSGQGTFPQAFLDRSTYATPSQMPTSAEVVASDYDKKTEPYTGDITRMAEGGNTSDQFTKLFDQQMASQPSAVIPTSQAVQDYNKILSARALDEYVNSPQLAAFRAASPVAAAPAAKEEAPAAITPDIKGLYQYYLGRQPTEAEIPQWANVINGPVTPDMANYFSQFTGGELAKTGYKPKGPNQFLGQTEGGMFSAPQNVNPIGMTGTLNTELMNMAGQPGVGLGAAALPQYSYNPTTRTYTRMASGGIADLGGYSDGGRLLKGPGDGMSDNIPASIANKQPARLADGEFVVPADVVSHLGNGSTDAGAKKLYAMMDNVRKARTGNKKQGKQIKAEKYLPK